MSPLVKKKVLEKHTPSSESEPGFEPEPSSEPEPGFKPNLGLSIEHGFEPGFELDLEPRSQLARQLQYQLE